MLGWEVDHVLPALVEDDVDPIPIPIPADDFAVVVQPGGQRPVVFIHRDLLDPVAQGQGPAVGIMQRKVTQGTGSVPGRAPTVLGSGSGSWGARRHGGMSSLVGLVKGRLAAGS